ncbi:MAG: leucine--tRNA ligase [SAR86 cluster bacterium]|uniref:Leucine--tRNA ligase n=1 Tax=SAR86 cluster bacterium TaxID=2030880 RepID=A0A520MV46_9GAMM|nr:MAG: leucine--tRNA ligase [SAR86 cluster bacterium]
MSVKEYNPAEVESLIQQSWKQNNSYKASPSQTKEKFYCLSMFPYPSGKLHMGHVRNYTIGDVISRFKRMQGFNVFQPMGWDAFGLPAENAAIKNKVDPQSWTEQNIENMKSQLERLGFSYDWSKELKTCDPNYFKWEQEIFTMLHKRGLVYRKKSLVNWDPVDETVLANEQVIDGKGWRSGATVELKEIDQWFLKITDYADELLSSVESLDWPENVKAMQKNWIGKSFGSEIKFSLNNEEDLTAFTTRIDTLYGVTFIAISPNHPLAQNLAKESTEISDFVKQCNETKMAEADMAKADKLGFKTNVKVQHPFLDINLDVWIANYVLMDYGTGVVMGVPAHDERDYEFAKKYNIEIKKVIECDELPSPKKGKLIDSDYFTGQESDEAIRNINARLEQNKIGKSIENFRLRDWGVSRQRFWGCPIPVIYEDGEPIFLEDKDLPVRLPKIEDGESPKPLSQNKNFFDLGPGKSREVDTFDTFVDSSWYYARFTAADNNEKALDENSKYWLPVDLYVGGIEHAILHLLYSRFFHKAMRDIGLVDGDEPFKKLLTQGMVLKDGYKMSKSKGNTVDPQKFIDQYGADTIRLYMMFTSPPEQSLEWSDTAIEGSYRFLKRVWNLVSERKKFAEQEPNEFTKHELALRQKSHKTLKKVTHDYAERNSFNTAIASIMELLNAVPDSFKAADATKAQRFCLDEVIQFTLKMLSPITPHISLYLWQEFTESEGDDFENSWPTFNEEFLQLEEFQLIIQVNGKVRGKENISVDTEQAQLEILAKENENVKKILANQPIKKVIYIKEKLINFVI